MIRPVVRDIHTRATCRACGAKFELNLIPIRFKIQSIIRVHRYPSAVNYSSNFTHFSLIAMFYSEIKNSKLIIALQSFA
jgi:hypothetical protein